jgi:hypothetical protein
VPRVIGDGLELVRPGGGRHYELRRSGEVVGTVQRRGILRPRYTADVGGAHWRFDKPRSQRMAVIDEAADSEVARLEVVDDAFRLFAQEDSRRVDPAPAMRQEDGARSFFDEAGRPLVTMRHLGGRQDTIATVEAGEQPWPSLDPDAGLALAVAVLAVRLVADRDDQSAQAFSAQ